MSSPDQPFTEINDLEGIPVDFSSDMNLRVAFYDPELQQKIEINFGIKRFMDNGFLVNLTEVRHFEGGRVGKLEHKERLMNKQELKGLILEYVRKKMENLSRVS